MTEKEPSREQQASDVSQLLLRAGRMGRSTVYEVLSYPSSDITLPEGGLKVDLDLTDIKDRKILEMITGDVKFILEDSEKAKRFFQLT